MNITTAAELDALPVGSVVIDAFAAACVKARQTEPSMPSDWVRVTTAVKGGEHHHRPFVPGMVVRHGLDDPDQQPTAQPAYRYPVTDDTGTVIAYDLHPPEHYHQPPTADYWRERANALDQVTVPGLGTFASQEDADSAICVLAAPYMLGVQQWMALDLDMALGHREHPAPNENGGRASWADWWSELLVEVRDLTATAVLHDYEIKSGRGGAGDE